MKFPAKMALCAAASVLALGLTACSGSGSARINTLVNQNLLASGATYSAASFALDTDTVSLIREAADACSRYKNSLTDIDALCEALEDAGASRVSLKNKLAAAKADNLAAKERFAQSLASFAARGIGTAYEITPEDVPAGLENEQAVAAYVASLLTGSARVYVSDLIALPILDDEQGTYTGNETYLRYAYIEAEPAAAFSNSYDNTERLLERFPVANPTPIESDLEKKIQNRLLNGFYNYNLGYDAWKAWGDILYTPDSLYNIHGVHLTLAEYQQSQNIALQSSDLQMGSFQNMLICGDWCAIRYDITATNRKTGETTPGSVMEFVHFKDYGSDLGARVVEGWAGTKGADFGGMSSFQTEDETAAQAQALAAVCAYEIPQTDDLAQKYPVLNPTANHSAWEAEITAAILQDFDQWNRGADAWAAWAQSYYSDGYVSHADTGDLAKADYIASVQQAAQSTQTTRLYFDNLLISGDWAAIHYRVTYTDTAAGTKQAGDVMQFLHFVKDGSRVKVTESWTK